MDLPSLKSGDVVEIVAPASRCEPFRIEAVKELLTSWGLQCIIPDDIFGDDLFSSNSDERRLLHLKTALYRPESKALICIRGGYGSMRLIPALSTLTMSPPMKLFVGMSDITALHLFFQKRWKWPTIHAGISPDKFSKESLMALKSLLFAEQEEIVFADLKPLNEQATTKNTLAHVLTGGNLTMVQASIGTLWQIEATNKILLLEDVAERGYRIDRMLEHLRQANVFSSLNALVFADFIEGNEPNGKSLVMPALKRFAESCEFPVFKMAGIGHDYINFPIPLGMPVCISDNRLYCKPLRSGIL